MTGPNPNMGTAHGRIRITVDDRQAQALNRNFASLDATMSKMQTSMSKMQASMTRMERSVSSISSELQKARKDNDAYAKSLDSLEDSFDGIGLTTRNWNRDLGLLRQNIHAARAAAERLIPPLQTLSDIRDIVGAFNDKNKGVFGLAKGLTAAGSAAGGLTLLRNQLLGVNKAMADLPRWQQNIVRTVGRIQSLGFVAGGAFAGLNRVVRTFSLGKIRLDALTTGKAIEFLGLRSEGAGKLLDELTGRSRRLGRALASIPRGTMQAITGFAVMRSGIQGLVNNFGFLSRSLQFWSRMFPGFTAAIATSIAAIPAIIEVGAKALVGFSNILLGALDAVKQLSGGLLVLPGLFAVIGAGVTTLAATFTGLKDKFKDLFSDDPTKQLEAFYKLPEHLRGIGQLILDTIPKIKDFQKALQIRAIDGFADQARSLIDVYLPRLQGAMLGVVTSFRNAKDQVVGFLAEAKTISALDTIYSRTAQIINGLAPAIQPALGAIRDVAVVGATWLRDMVPMFTILVQKAAEWGRVNSENGNVMRWIKDSYRGLIDLKNTIVDVVDATWSLLTMFSTNTGENGLERLAAGAEKVNAAIQKSLDSGFLKGFGDAVRGAGSQSIEHLLDILRSLAEPLKQLVPLVQDISTGFSNKMVPAIKAAAQALEFIFDFLNETGLGVVIGSILGTVAAFKLLGAVLGPIKNLIKVVFGALIGTSGLAAAAKGIEAVSLALSVGLDRFGKYGKIVGNTVLTVGGAAGRLVTILSGLGAAIAVVTVAWIAYSGRGNKIKQTNDEIAESSQHAKERVQELRKAFIADETIIGNNVLDTLDQQMQTVMQDMGDLAAQAPSLMDHIGDVFAQASGEKLTPGLFSETEAFNAAQNASEAAERIKGAFDRTGTSAEDLKNAVSGSLSVFSELSDKLRDSGEGGQEAADKLREWRTEFQKVQEDMRALGPGGAQLAKGIQEIANAGGDATTKLEGLKLVLQGLGILKTDSLDAAFAYAEGIRNLTKDVQELSTQGINFSDALNADGKSFNTASEGANELYNILKPLGDQFLAQVANGADAQVEYAKFEEQLKSLSASTRLPIEALKSLAEQVGLAPKPVGLAIQVEGKEQFVQDVTQVLLAAQAKSADGVKIPVHVADPAGVERELEAVVGDVFNVEGSNLVIKPGLDEAKMAQVAAVLAQKGIQVPGAPPPPAISKLPIGPSTAETGKIGTDPQTREPERAAADGLAENLNERRGNFDDFINGIIKKADGAADQAEDSGRKFVDEYAAGLRGNSAAIDEAERMAQEIRDRFHHSPPKKGPLAAHGDAALYAGQQFGSVYAAGMAAQTATVAGAASSVAGAASSGLKGDKSYESGKFLGQISSLIDFASNFASAMEKLAQSVIGFGKFISDPEGKGTYFGKSLGFKRDKAISDTDLTARRQDAAQQRIFSFFGSKQYPQSNIDWNTGMPKITGPGQLDRNASKSDIQAAVAAAGQAAGASKEDIAAAYAVIEQESGYSPTIVGKGKGGGGADAIGLFQQTLGMWGTMEELTNPNIAIQKYWDAWKKANPGSPAGRAVGTQNPGGYGTKEIEKRMAEGTLRELESILSSGALLPTTSGGVIPGIPALGGLTRPSILHDTGKIPSQPLAVQASALIAKLFPQITGIGGSRDTGTAKGTHDIGTSIDIEIPGWDTPAGKKLGDEINNWVRANASALGVQYTIWQDTWKDFKGGTSTVSGHKNHIDVHFADGGVADIGPGGTNIKVPYGSPGSTDLAFGPPPRPDEEAPTRPDLVVRNPDGTFSPVHGAQQGALPGNAKINPATGQPWTPEEAAAFWNRPENAPQYDQAQLEGTQLGQPGMFQGTQEELLEETKRQTPLLEEAVAFAESPTPGTEADAIRYADVLGEEIARQNAINTPESRARAQQIQGVQSQITGDYGLTQEQNPFDKASEVVGSISSIAGDLFKVFNSTVEAIAATKDITETLVRYPSNTEDIFRMIDDFQKYIQLGADIAGAVSSIASAAGSLTGGMDFGATSAVGTIAGLIQSALETINAFIDLGQEAYRIIGSYVGDFLGYLFGAGDPLRGNVRFLLDETTNQLLAYSQDNPLDKRAHTLPGQAANPNARNQLFGDVNVYGGPARDPRDDTRQMMFQVKASQMMVATAQ